MKTLDDYLATTSSDEEEEPELSTTQQAPGSGSVGSSAASAETMTTTPVAGPSVVNLPTARTPTTAAPLPNEARQRQDEMRERMARLLGQETVSNIAASAASESSMTPVSAASPTVPFPTVGAPTARSTATAAATSNSSSPPANALERTVMPSAATAAATPQAPQYDRVQVMVVDRGTQTVSTVGTQTDPVWPVPQSALPIYMEPVMLPGRGYGGGPVRALAPPIGSGGFGVDGRPYRQLVDDLSVKQMRDTVVLREQLDMIQNSIDMLIARYNLPPPP